MASSTTRQRKLERARHERRMARQADKLRRSRQVKAAVAGTLGVLLVVFGGLWLLGVFDKKAAPPEAAKECTWNPQSTDANDKLSNEGTPPTTGIPSTGVSIMSLSLGTGKVTAELNRAVAKCATASLTFLANKGFYNGSKCHSLTHAEGSFALGCGDKSGSGNGGAAYTWYPENLPIAEQPPAPTASPAPSASPSAAPQPVRYPKGTVAMMPTLNGSQFMIFYKDSTTTGEYSIVGKVTSGLDVIEKIAAAGTVANEGGSDIKPKQEVQVQSMAVTDGGNPPAPSPAVTPSATPAATVSPKPSASK